MSRVYEKRYGGQRKQTTTSLRSLPALPCEMDEAVAFKLMMAIPFQDRHVRWLPFESGPCSRVRGGEVDAQSTIVSW